MAQWVRAAGLQWRESAGICYNPFTKRYRLHPTDVSANYLVHTQNI